MQRRKTSESEIAFHRVSLDDKSLFAHYIEPSEEQNCDLNFANIFCWSDTYHSEVAEAEGFLVIRFYTEGAMCYMQPVGCGDKRQIMELRRHDAFVQRMPLRLYGLSHEWRNFLEENYPSEFAFDTPRAACDYIYRTEDLARLQGRKYQQLPLRPQLQHQKQLPLPLKIQNQQFVLHQAKFAVYGFLILKFLRF